MGTNHDAYVGPLPAGGAGGFILEKKSAVDGDIGWVDPSATFVPVAGTHLAFDPTGLTGPGVLITGITGQHSSAHPIQPIKVKSSDGVQVTEIDDQGGIHTTAYISIVGGVAEPANGTDLPVTIAGQPSYMLGVLSDIGASPIIVVQATGTGDALQLYGAGSPTQPLFALDHLGVLHFGPGGAAATDTTLSRSAAGVIASSGGFQIANGSTYGSTGEVYIQASGITHAVNIGDVGATYMVIKNGTFGVFSKTAAPAAQATATPAAATDLASAIALVNAIRTAQLAYGWMA